MNKRKKPTINDSGFASIMVALLLVTILALLTVGFARLARREQQTALDKTLTNQAFYAAESGINDLSDYIQKNPHNLPADSNNCIPNSTLTSTYGLNPNVGGSNSGVSYTCVLLNLTNPNGPAWFPYDDPDPNASSTTQASPQFIAYDGNNIWFSNTGTQDVGVMSTSGGSPTFIGTSPHPNGLVYDPVYNKMLVAEIENNTIARISDSSPYTVESHMTIAQPPVASSYCAVNGNTHPVDLAVDPNGNVWITAADYPEQGPGCIYVMNPSTGAMVASYGVPDTNGCFPNKIVSAPDDPTNPSSGGKMYFTMLVGSSSDSAGHACNETGLQASLGKGVTAIFSIPYPAGGDNSYPLDCGASSTAGCVSPTAYTQGFSPSSKTEGVAYSAAYHKVYFADTGNNKVGVLDLSSGNVSYPAALTNIGGGANVALDDMTADSQGNIWLAYSGPQGNKVGEINPSNDSLKEWAASPPAPGGAWGFTALVNAPYKNNTSPGGMWITGATANKLMVLDPQAGGSTTYIDVTGKARNVLKRLRATVDLSGGSFRISNITSLPPVL